MKAFLLQSVIALIFALPAYSQTTTFRVAMNLVLTPVWVLDEKGQTVRDLKIEDFEIEEDGIKTAPVRLGAPGEAPLEIVMLFDASGSVISKFGLQRLAAIRFLRQTLRPIDSIFLLAISNTPKTMLARTSSLEEAIQAVNRIPPTSEATAFYNTIAQAAHMLQSTALPEARRVMIAISDGEDNRSLENEFKDALRELQSADCLFYAINPRGNTYQIGFLGRRAQENMDAMAKQTGGTAFIAKEEADLAAFFDRIAGELQNQYLLGYDSPAAGRKGNFRRIVIRVKGRPGLQVKARPGYYAH